MVHDQNQQVLPFVQPEQPCPQQRTALQVKQRRRLAFDDLIRLRLPLAAGKPRAIDQRQFDFKRADDALEIPLRAERAAQRLVPRDELLQGPTQGIHLQVARQPQRAGFVVGGGDPGSHLRGKPHLVLRIGQRHQQLRGRLHARRVVAPSCR